MTFSILPVTECPFAETKEVIGGLTENRSALAYQMSAHLSCLLSLLFLLSATIATHADQIEPKTFIREKGTYTFDDKGSSIEVITAKDGIPSLVINFRSRSKSSTGTVGFSSDKEGILRAAGWFVFVESPNRLWIYDGKTSLAVAEADDAHASVKLGECDPAAAVVCPKQVKDALPPKVRDDISARANKHKAKDSNR
ncbi:MAG TPA: hypothetical protein VM680_01280 [Verrucomicrobiae bacterium]|nr:hypothetical protein [Verrucomicrobiae bacterium]